ncbi:MAG: WG repeat-containing protein [Clostridia bacterium]|nr:WG repeat-containing protein [Clostridia bacterium]
MKRINQTALLAVICALVLIIVLQGFAFSGARAASGVFGDVNGDGVVNIKDMLCIRDIIFGKEPLASVNPDAKTGATLFHQGLLPARIDRKWGYVDKTGEVVIQPEFDKAYPFASNGLALVIPDLNYDKNGSYKHGYINTQGEMVIEPIFDYADDFAENGLAAVSIYDEKEKRFLGGYINDKGEYAIQPRGDWSVRSFSENGLARVDFYNVNGQGHRVCYINEKGEFVLSLMFDVEFFLSPFSNGLAELEIESKRGFINEKGVFVIPAQYDDARSFSEYGLAAVKLGDKWGFIDKTGEFVIEPQYNYVWSGFGSTGIAIVGDSWTGEMRYIDKNGDTVLETEGAIFEFNNGLALGGGGYIDINGNTVISIDCECVAQGSWIVNNGVYGFYDDGYAICRVNGKDGVIDKKGNFVIEPMFEWLQYSYEHADLH